MRKYILLYLLILPIMVACEKINWFSPIQAFPSQILSEVEMVLRLR